MVQLKQKIVSLTASVQCCIAQWIQGITDNLVKGSPSKLTVVQLFCKEGCLKLSVILFKASRDTPLRTTIGDEDGYSSDSKMCYIFYTVKKGNSIYSISKQ